MSEQVVLVDPDGRDTGASEKLEAHRRGLLHRAFSVFVFDGSGRLLIQKRAASKYHSAGLWSNTCCGHPRPGEDRQMAARRRLREELGFDCELTESFSFVYRCAFANGLVEHELDHVFVGRFEGIPVADPDEVETWLWIDLDSLSRDVGLRPAAYSYWLRHCLERVLAHSSVRQLSSERPVRTTGAPATPK